MWTYSTLRNVTTVENKLQGNGVRMCTGVAIRVALVLQRQLWGWVAAVVGDSGLVLASASPV